MIPLCLTLSIIRYLSMIKWSNPGEEVAPFPSPQCSSYRKGSLRVALDYGHQLTVSNALTKKEIMLKRIVCCINQMLFSSLGYRLIYVCIYWEYAKGFFIFLFKKYLSTVNSVSRFQKSECWKKNQKTKYKF